MGSSRREVAVARLLFGRLGRHALERPEKRMCGRAECQKHARDNLSATGGYRTTDRYTNCPTAKWAQTRARATRPSAAARPRAATRVGIAAPVAADVLSVAKAVVVAVRVGAEVVGDPAIDDDDAIDEDDDVGTAAFAKIWALE